MAASRFTLTTSVEFPPERDVTNEEARTGVFVCHCGSNIAGFLDVSAVTEHARGLPHVVHAESNLYSCSQDSIRHISEVIAEQGLNRVVVASCSPLTHQPLFQDSLRAAGLNPYLFEDGEHTQSLFVGALARQRSRNQKGKRTGSNGGRPGSASQPPENG